MTANVTKEEFNKKCMELITLLAAHRGSNVMQRVTLYVVAKTKQKLNDYVRNEEAPLDERNTIVDELLGIVKSNAWDKLPAAPSGQAQANGAAPASPLKPLVNLAPPPVPESAPVPVPEPVGVLINAVSPEPEAEPEADDPLAIITAQLAKLTKPQAKGLTEQDVMRIVRREMAACLVTIAGILNK